MKQYLGIYTCDKNNEKQGMIYPNFRLTITSG